MQEALGSIPNTEHIRYGRSYTCNLRRLKQEVHDFKIILD